MFPRALLRVHSMPRTPYLAIGLVGVIASAFTLLGDVGTVAALANLSMLTLFMLVNASLIQLRYTADATEEAFKAPLNVGRLLLTPIAGLLSTYALIIF